MQIRPQGWLYIAAFAALTSGCAVFDSENEQQDARSARLPTGVTLLDSSREECAGSVAIDDAVIESARREDLVVQRGQNATFEIDADADEDVEIEWTCVGTADTERETIECPEDTSWLRVTRAAGDDFLLECYGEGSSSRRARR
jgi:hypothetical protein